LVIQNNLSNLMQFRDKTQEKQINLASQQKIIKISKPAIREQRN